MIRKRILGLALIALAVPFPALALEGGGVAASGSPGLTVTASLDSCGLAGSQIMCQIDAGWNSLEGADSYSVSVTSAGRLRHRHGRDDGPGHVGLGAVRRLGHLLRLGRSLGHAPRRGGRRLARGHREGLVDVGRRGGCRCEEPAGGGLR